MRLSATKAMALRKPGRYTDGAGLHLFVSKTGKKSWVQRITVDGKRRDIGLGGFPAVSLASARERSADVRTAVADGKDPLVEKRKPGMPTLREAAYTVHKENRPRWRNAKHAAAWIQTLERYAFPMIGNKRIDRIERADVLTVLTPIWSTRQETARRVRQRLRTIFSWAMAHGLIETNPAGEVINAALPSMPKVKAHFRAMPYVEVPSALEKVEASQASKAAKLCLRFLVLTSVRSGEARGARWGEIDLRGRIWRIPSLRMKAGSEHRVPLSRQAVELLHEASELRGDTDLVFPSPQKRGDQLSDMTLTKVLRSLGLAERTTVPRVPEQLQELDPGADGHALGRLRGGPGPHPGELDRTGLCEVGPVRAPPRPDAEVGRLRIRLTSGYTVARRESGSRFDGQPVQGRATTCTDSATSSSPSIC